MRSVPKLQFGMANYALNVALRIRLHILLAHHAADLGTGDATRTKMLIPGQLPALNNDQTLA